MRDPYTDELNERLLTSGGQAIVPHAFVRELHEWYGNVERPLGVLRFRPPFKVTRRQRLAWWWAQMRERVGFAIAGYDPRELDD